MIAGTCSNALPIIIVLNIVNNVFMLGTDLLWLKHYWSLCYLYAAHYRTIAKFNNFSWKIKIKTTVFCFVAEWAHCQTNLTTLFLLVCQKKVSKHLLFVPYGWFRFMIIFSNVFCCCFINFSPSLSFELLLEFVNEIKKYILLNLFRKNKRKRKFRKFYLSTSFHCFSA